MPERGLLDPATDEALSALVDGELDPAAASALRERAASEPALARRLEELEAVDARLRALPAPPVSADLRERLRARIEAENANDSPPLGRAARARRVPWAIGFGLAAGLALYLWVGGPREPEPAEPGGSRIAREPVPAPLAPPPAPLTPEPGELRIADASGPPEPEADDPGALDESELADDELAIALELDALRDFELIDQLELLEALAAAADAETSG
jgi:hypothetical protein